jgi:hypothetical protein
MSFSRNFNSKSPLNKNGEPEKKKSTADAMNTIMKGSSKPRTSSTAKQVEKAMSKTRNFSNLPINDLPSTSGSGELVFGSAPITGEILDAKDLVTDIKNKNYVGAAISAAGLTIPFVSGKLLKKGFELLKGGDLVKKNVKKSVSRVGERAGLNVAHEKQTSRFMEKPTEYNNSLLESEEVTNNALDYMKQKGKDLDKDYGYFNYEDLTQDNVKFHGVKHGRSVAEVELPDGSTQLFYKSSGLAGKKGAGVGGTTEGLWQPYAGHANVPGSQNWFIKDAGYEDFYGSNAFRDIAGNLDRLSHQGGWSMSGQLKSSANKVQPHK